MTCVRRSARRSVVLAAMALAAWTETSRGQMPVHPVDAPASPASRPSPYAVQGITAPRQVATLAALQLQRISEITVAEGRAVRKGDVLILFDDHVQRMRTEIARAAAESTLEIDMAAARLEQAQSEYARLLELNKDQHASRKELLDARVAAELARLDHAMARLRHAQAGREQQREQYALDLFRIRAPFDGYVTELFKHPGETANEGERILTLVQLDPVEVAVNCPLSFARAVRVGARAKVTPVDAQWPARTGEVVFANRAADAASQTFKVKLSVPNADMGWMTGLKVLVDFAVTDPEPTDHAGPSAGVADGRPPSAHTAVADEGQ